MNFYISTISSDLQSKMCQDSKKWGHMTGAFLRIIFNLKTLKHNMESRLVKSIFLKNPPVHDNIFFESWFNFDCESDGIIGIPKFTFLESIGTKFEANHFFVDKIISNKRLLTSNWKLFTKLSYWNIIRINWGVRQQKRTKRHSHALPNRQKSYQIHKNVELLIPSIQNSIIQFQRVIRKILWKIFTKFLNQFSNEIHDGPFTDRRSSN